MRKPVLVLMSTIFAILACNPSGNQPVPEPLETTPIAIPKYPIQGLTFLDMNEDGIFQPDVDELLDDIRVDLFTTNSPDSPVQTIFESQGEFRFEAVAGIEYFLQFTPSQELASTGFTAMGRGDDAIDSDVNENGKTDPFTLTADFNRTLSAGYLPAVPPVEVVVHVEDNFNDCRAQNQEATQACPADIRSCSVNIAGAPDDFIFLCALESFDNPTEFDLYISLNLDTDPATGITDSEREGIDAEIYANGLDNFVNFNRYDASGIFLSTSQLAPEIASLSFQSSEDLSGGVLVVNLSLDEELRETIPADTEVSFRAIHFPASGTELHDDTPAVGGIFLGEHPLDEDSHIVHTVQAGENLFRISLLYGVPIEIILTANDLGSGQLTVGQRLDIPRDGWD